MKCRDHVHHLSRIRPLADREGLGFLIISNFFAPHFYINLSSSIDNKNWEKESDFTVKYSDASATASDVSADESDASATASNVSVNSSDVSATISDATAGSSDASADIKNAYFNQKYQLF